MLKTTMSNMPMAMNMINGRDKDWRGVVSCIGKIIIIKGISTLEK